MTATDTQAVRLSRRFKVRFPEAESFRAARAAESPFLYTPVANPKRSFVSVALPEEPPDLALRERLVDDQLMAFVREYGAEIVEDYQYSLEGVYPSPDDFQLPVAPEEVSAESLDDVLAAVRAPEAWSSSRGAGVVIAVVDTGINGSRPELPMSKRVGQWSAIGEDAWTDYRGHGTMCATIAAGTRADGGEFDGVAPDAAIISCRTRFFDSELATIYDYLGDYAEEHGVAVVATNSFGVTGGTPPDPPADSDFVPALDEAIDRGVHAFFSAGNYHAEAGGRPDQCSPTSIWLYKCRADVFVVAASRTDGEMWHYSSRGPGQLSGEPGMAAKPDATAPTPPNGRVVYGDRVRSLPDGWGTSGACPQVAGLAALLLAKDASLAREQLFEVIRDTASSLGHDATCEGSGLIDCQAALSQL